MCTDTLNSPGGRKQTYWKGKITGHTIRQIGKQLLSLGEAESITHEYSEPDSRETQSNELILKTFLPFCISKLGWGKVFYQPLESESVGRSRWLNLVRSCLFAWLSPKPHIAAEASAWNNPGSLLASGSSRYHQTCRKVRNHLLYPFRF